jgi:hypothetical protein
MNIISATGDVAEKGGKMNGGIPRMNDSCNLSGLKNNEYYSPADL